MSPTRISAKIYKPDSLFLMDEDRNWLYLLIAKEIVKVLQNGQPITFSEVKWESNTNLDGREFIFYVDYAPVRVVDLTSVISSSRIPDLKSFSFLQRIKFLFTGKY